MQTGNIAMTHFSNDQIVTDLAATEDNATSSRTSTVQCP